MRINIDYEDKHHSTMTCIEYQVSSFKCDKVQEFPKLGKIFMLRNMFLISFLLHLLQIGCITNICDKSRKIKKSLACWAGQITPKHQSIKHPSSPIQFTMLKLNRYVGNATNSMRDILRTIMVLFNHSHYNYPLNRGFFLKFTNISLSNL